MEKAPSNFTGLQGYCEQVLNIFIDRWEMTQYQSQS
jgi:hypothetical protein